MTREEAQEIFVREWAAAIERDKIGDNFPFRAIAAGVHAVLEAHDAQRPTKLNQFVLQPNHRVEITGETAVIESISDHDRAVQHYEDMERMRDSVAHAVRETLVNDFKRLEAENKDLTNRLAEALATSFPRRDRL